LREHCMAREPLFDRQQSATKPAPRPITPVRAREIKAALDKAVVGQEQAKVALSVLFSMHTTWAANGSRLHQPPNALVLGPTGVGKTHTLRTAAEFLGVPFHIVDATSLAPTSFHGLQIPDMLKDSLLGAAGDLEYAQRGIIFIDEFDKLAYSEHDDVTNRHFRHLQRTLLKLIEGSSVPLPGTGILFDTSGVRFICGGAFTGISEPTIRRKRPPEVARRLPTQDIVISADVVSFGFIPELVARLPLIVQFNQLTHQDLREIMDNPIVTPCEIWRRHFQQCGKKLTFEPEALEQVAKSALDLAMGARGLGQVLFGAMVSKAYDMESDPATDFTFSVSDIRFRASTMGGVR
jgi:ATP-dependent Clp protease ATP-binding subunit ClpX